MRTTLYLKLREDQIHYHRGPMKAEIVLLICYKCKSQFSCLARLHRKRMKRGYERSYCSCHNTKKRIKKKCAGCDQFTVNPKFCSHSCAARISNVNRTKSKWKTLNKCIDCELPAFRISSRCINCHKLYVSQRELDTQLQAIKDTSKTKDFHSRVRDHARKLAIKAKLLDACKKCGYTYKVECCHIQAVKKFPLTATLGEVNSINNLVGLCPNHHTELDGGILKL